jgi:hypothetical protein
MLQPTASCWRGLSLRTACRTCNRTGSLNRQQEANKPFSSFLVGRGSDMAINRELGIRSLTAGLLLLSLTCVLNGAGSSDQIRSVAISPDGKLVAVDFHKGNTSFIYKIAVDTGVATRLTDAKDGEEPAQLSRRTGSASHMLTSRAITDAPGLLSSMSTDQSHVSGRPHQ